MMSRIGFVGTGTLSEAVVVALCGKYDGALSIVLSPRSAQTSARLAQRFPNVQVAGSNAEVVERCDTVILATRPQQIDQALDGVSFRAGQTVVSFIAKMRLQEVQLRVGPGVHTCRVTPLPSIARRKGPIVLYPRQALVAELFTGLGDLIMAGSEEEAIALGDAAGLMSTYFELQVCVSDWLAQHGADPDHASLYVRSMFEALADTAAATPADELDGLALRHETAGGLNERCRRSLRDARWFAQVRDSLDALNRSTTLRVATEKA